MNQASSRTRVRVRRAITASIGVLALFAFDAGAGSVSKAAAQDPVDELASPNPRVRRKAASDLARSKSPDALPRLAALVRDPDPEVRLAVVRSIASLREIVGIPSMVVFMTDAESRLRSEAIDGTVEIYTGRDRPRTSKFLSIFSDGRDKPEPLVVAAVDFQVYRSLAELLRDSDREVRESAAEAIGILGGTEVAADLLISLGDAASEVRAAAVSALVKVGTSADGEALLPMLKDSSSTVRRRAIAGLGRLKVVDAADELRLLFERTQGSEDSILALNSLAQIARPRDLELFQRLALQPDAPRRRPSIEALARLAEVGNEARFKRSFQREKDDELRAAYALAIFLFGDRPFIDTVVMGLQGSRDRERQSRGYLEELGAKALPEVLDYFREPDAKVRAGLCDALANAGIVDALPSIEPLTRDRDAQVRASAARAVAILGRLR